MADEKLSGKKTYKDYSISFARFIAMLFIILCHICQRDDISTDIFGVRIAWAFWLNVGVQMFLFLSGYLYGIKETIDVVSFYKKNFPKLLVDYYIYIFIIFIINHFVPLMELTHDQAVELITFTGTIPGLGHLWFVPIILLCYLLTPIISEIFNAIDKRRDMRLWIESIIVLLIIHNVMKLFFDHFNYALINCYAIGMFYSKVEKRSLKNRLCFFCAIVILYYANRIGYFKNYGHVFLGIAIVLLIRSLYKKIDCINANHRILDWSDKYSYDVYLVHHLFIQSSFGVVEFIPNRFIAIPLAVLLSVFSAVVLHWISNLLRNKLNPV